MIAQPRAELVLPHVGFGPRPDREDVVSWRPSADAGVFVQRPELFARLEHGLSGRLTLITGAPGSGKTVLLSSWLKAGHQLDSVAWMSLEPSDGRPIRFWTEFIACVGKAAGLPLSDRLDPADKGFEAALAAVCAELPLDVLVVLDDFEQVRSWRTIQSLDRFLHTPQPRVHVTIATRQDPGLSLQRMRLAGQVTELRSADLAFSYEHACELFEIAGLKLHPEQIRTLHERTEGWIGGLRLGALSLMDHPDPDAFVRDFAGDERAISDYLVEEVLHQQPTEVREFMLKTSVVDELEPDLVTALTGRSDAMQTLERLERSNAFLEPLDDRRQRYRYHSMFLELLRSQLRYRMPDALALGHRRAAHWYAARSRPASSVRHALAAGDEAAATEMLSEHWLTLVVRGYGQQVGVWIDKLDRHVIVENAEVAAAAAGAALAGEDLEKSDGYLALADARAGTVPAKRRARYTLSRAVLAMLHARVRGDYEAARTAAHKVLANHELAVAPDDTRTVAHLSLGISECWATRPEGVGHLEQTLEMAERASSGFLVVDCLSQLALFKALSGSLNDTVSFGHSAVLAAIKHGWDEHPTVAPAHLAMAIARLNRADRAGAVDQLERALQAVQPTAARVTRCLIDLVRAHLIAHTDPGQAIRIAHATAQDCRRWQMPAALASHSGFLEAAAAVHAGQHERATLALERHELRRRAPIEHAVVSARLALADGQPLAAVQLLQSDLIKDATPLYPSTRIEAIALAALCRYQQHDDVGALELVEQALGLSQPEGYRLPLLTIGPPLRELLKRRIRAGTAHRALAGELIEILEDGSESTSGRSEAPTLLEPLSDREEAVLRYLPTIMSKAEIASELFVSVNTIKTHTKNIYRKLDVGSRTEAVRRAKNLNLL